MDNETLLELAKRFEERKTQSHAFMVDWCEGYNAAIKHVVRELRIIAEAQLSVQRLIDSPETVESPIVIDPPDGKPEFLREQATAAVQPQIVEIQKGELPDGWQFLNVGDFLKTGDVLNSTGMSITIDRDDVRVTASKTWRRKA